MATLSLDLRQRIVSTCDRGEGTQEQIARRFGVSHGMVKKLLQQRKKTGCIKARHHLAGRKKRIVAEHCIAIGKHLKRKPDMTLAELRTALGLECTLPAIHCVLAGMGLTYKRRSTPPNKTAKTSARRGDGAISPRLAKSYQHYRTERITEKLALWLKEKGVEDRKYLHTLRKVFGSLVAQEDGIYAASRALRHADIQVTAKHYLDKKQRISIGLGRLLRPDNVQAVDFAKAAKESTAPKAKRAKAKQAG